MADEADKPRALCWVLSRDKEYNYHHLHLWMFEAVVEPVQAQIDEAMSHTRWSSPETAARMEVWYRSVLARGFTETYDPPWYPSDKPSFRLSWQEYDPGRDMDSRSKGYTGHKISQLGNDKFDSAAAGLGLLDQVRKKVGRLFPQVAGGDPQLDDPRYVIRAVEAMGAVPVERLDQVTSEPTTWVKRAGRRMRLRTEGVVALFGP